MALDASTGALRWQYGDRDALPFASPPLVEGGMAYAGTRTHEVIALDVRTGTIRWRTTVHGTVLAIPQLRSGVLVVATTVFRDEPTSDARVYALDPQTGALRWSLSGEHSVYLLGSSADAFYVNLGDDRLSAVRPSDGGVLWRSAQAHVGRSSVADDHGLVYVSMHPCIILDAPPPSCASDLHGQPDAYLVGLDARDGTQRWQAPLPGTRNPCDMGAQEGYAYCITQGRLVVFDGNTGKERWRIPGPELPDGLLGGAGVRGTTLHDGLIYISKVGGDYAALDAATGNIRWSTSSLFETDWGMHVANWLAQDYPLVANGVLFSTFLGSNAQAGIGAIVALDAQTGAVRWHTQLPRVGAWPRISVAP